MAIKIIKEGNLNRIPVYIQECQICGCTFEYNKEDITYKGKFRYIQCPNCNNNFCILTKLIPIRYDQ